MWTRMLFACFLTGSLALAACGEDSADTSSSGGQSGSGGSATGGSGGSTSGGDGGTSVGGTAGSTSGGSAGTSGSSGGTSTGGTAGSGSVACGTSTCAASEYCCHPSCVAKTSECSGFVIHCDDASDCPNAFCCASSPPGGGFKTAECAPTCDANGQMIVCKHADPSGCPSGMKCSVTAQLPPEYGFCD